MDIYLIYLLGIPAIIAIIALIYNVKTKRSFFRIIFEFIGDILNIIFRVF